MNALRAVLALPSLRVLLALCTLFGLGLTTVPLLGVHGVESAVLLGAVLPPLCAAIAARLAIAARADVHVTALPLLGRGVLAALLLLASPVIVLGLNALRVRNCAPLEGLAFIALGPGAGVVLAAALGVVVGALPWRPRLLTALAPLPVVADMLRAAHDFYASPAVFAYGHFFGYFPGSLYDDLIELPQPLLTLRFFSLAALLFFGCALACFYEPGRGLRRTLLPQRRTALAGMLAAGLALLVSYAKTEELGYRTSVAFIAKALGGHASSSRCELIYPRELRTNKRSRLLSDCDFRVEQIERFFGVSGTPRIRVLLFRSAGEKRALMGAADTNIAKPWRREIYLQDEGWPHPVMPHELAHIVAGQFGSGPLRIAGRLFGLWPDFALVEGAAVAGAWSTSLAAALTPHQWTRAMMELGLAPRLPQLFGAGFLGQQSRLAYTLSGSLLRYVSERYGKAALRRVYAHDDLSGVLGLSLPELERDFRRYVMSVPLPEAARALAKQRFEGSSILTGVCPHEKAKLRQELDSDLGAGDDAAAARTCQRLLAIDPGETSVRATLVAVLARRAQPALAERELKQLIGPPSAAPPVVTAARQALADEAWRAGQLTRAHALYEELLAVPSERDALRMLQVKTMALEGSARQSQLLFALLVGEPGQSTDGAMAVYLLRELRNERSDGLPYYLEARQLFMRERFAEAADLLETARARGLPTYDIAIEALRLLAMSRYVEGAYEEAKRLFGELAEQSKELALQIEAQDWLERIAFVSRAETRGTRDAATSDPASAR